MKTFKGLWREGEDFIKSGEVDGRSSCLGFVLVARLLFEIYDRVNDENFTRYSINLLILQTLSNLRLF